MKEARKYQEKLDQEVGQKLPSDLVGLVTPL